MSEQTLCPECKKPYVAKRMKWALAHLGELSKSILTGSKLCLDCFRQCSVCQTHKEINLDTKTVFCPACLEAAEEKKKQELIQKQD